MDSDNDQLEMFRNVKTIVGNIHLNQLSVSYCLLDSLPLMLYSIILNDLDFNFSDSSLRDGHIMNVG